jgi:hypothetical protein
MTPRQRACNGMWFVVAKSALAMTMSSSVITVDRYGT